MEEQELIDLLNSIEFGEISLKEFSEFSLIKAKVIIEIRKLYDNEMKMIILLKELEWSFDSEGDYQCPSCRSYRDENMHLLDCRLNAKLKS